MTAMLSWHVQNFVAIANFNNHKSNLKLLKNYNSAWNIVSVRGSGWNASTGESNRQKSRSIGTRKWFSKDITVTSHEHQNNLFHQSLWLLLNGSIRWITQYHKCWQLSTLFGGNPLVTGRFPAQTTSNVESVFMSRCQHENSTPTSLYREWEDPLILFPCIFWY